MPGRLVPRGPRGGARPAVLAAAAAAAAGLAVFGQPAAAAGAAPAAGAANASASASAPAVVPAAASPRASLTTACAALPEVSQYFFAGARTHEPLPQALADLPPAPPWFEPCQNPGCLRTCASLVTYEARCTDGNKTWTRTGAPSFPLCVPDICSGAADLSTMAQDMQVRWQFDLQRVHECAGAAAARAPGPAPAAAAAAATAEGCPGAAAASAVHCQAAVSVVLDCAPWGGAVEAVGDAVAPVAPRSDAPGCASSDSSLEELLRGERVGSGGGGGFSLFAALGSALGSLGRLRAPRLDADWGWAALVLAALLASAYALGFFGPRRRSSGPSRKDGFVAPSYQEAHHSTSDDGHWAMVPQQLAFEPDHLGSDAARPVELRHDASFSSHASAWPAPSAPSFAAPSFSPPQRARPARARTACCEEEPCCGDGRQSRWLHQGGYGHLQRRDEMESWWAERRSGLEDRGSSRGSSYRGYREYMDRFSQEAQTAGHLLGSGAYPETQTLKAMLAPLEDRRHLGSPLRPPPRGGGGAAVGTGGSGAWPQALPPGSLEV